LVAATVDFTPEEPGYLIGWVEVNTILCSVIDTGSWSTTSPPAHGALAFSIANMVVPDGEACSGYILPFNNAYYTWTDLQDESAQDPFSIEWSVAAGPEDSSWVATVGDEQPGEDTGSPDSPTAAPGTCYCGDPIDIGSGNVSYAVTDYMTAGANALAFNRYYNSRPDLTSYATELGHNWTDTYDRYLDVVSATAVIAERHDGQALNFTLAGSVWTSESDFAVTLTHSGSGTGSTWTLSDLAGTVETYKQLSTGEGLLQSIVARDGYTQTMHDNASNQLTSVTDSFGRALTLTYASGLLATVTAPNGLALTYGYGSSGFQPGVNDQLTSVTDVSAGATEAWLYDYVGYLLSFIQDSYTSATMGSYTNTDQTWNYDSAGRGLSSQATLTSPMRVSYDDATGNRTVTTPLGGQELYKFTTLQGLPKVSEIDRLPSAGVATATELFTYDANGYLASHTDWNGNQTTYTNNALGEVTSVTLAAGTSVAQTTTTTYDATFPDLPDQVVAPRQTDTYTYDASGDTLKRTATDTTGGPTNGRQRTWIYTYGAYGHELTATGPRTDVTATTTTAYDTKNDVTSVTDALGHVTSYTSYTADGLPLTITDPNGVHTTFTYDLHGRLLTQTVQAASGNAVTQFVYLSLAHTAATPDELYYPAGEAIYYTYDAAAKVIQADSGPGGVITYTRDGDEDIIQATTSFNGVAADQTATYDAFGRLTQTADGSGDVTTYTNDANGNHLQIQDPNGGITTQTFDALNRLTSSTDPLGGVTSSTYDGQNNLTSVTDPRHLTTTYTYDAFGDTLTQTSPDSGKTTSTYDGGGDLTSQTNSAGVVTNQTFDKLNRLLSQTYPAFAAENVAYTYDAHSATNDGIGSLTGMTDQSGSATFTYNEHGDTLSDTRVIAGKSYTTSYGYDLSDNVTSLTYPSGDIVTYGRYSSGQIGFVEFTPKATGNLVLLANYVNYEPAGPLTALTYGNGLVSTLTYDQSYRLTNILTSGAATVQNVSVAYDGDNNITALTDGLDASRSQTFSYDANDRLTSATGKYGAFAYTYDANGNQTSGVHNGVTTTETYAAASNALTSTSIAGANACQLSYTPTGDLAKQTCSYPSAAQPTLAETFTYGGRETLQQAAVTRNPPPGQTWASSAINALYTVNAFGQRVMKSVASGGSAAVATSYAYDEQGHLLAENNATTGAAQQEYVWIDDLPVAQIEANGTIYYIHPDQAGTPSLMTNAAQAVVWSRITEPFDGTWAINSQITNNLRSTGQYYDAETGLNDDAARYLNTSDDRYTQVDPTGLGGGANPYIYALANPLSWTDPTGMRPTLDNADRVAGVAPDAALTFHNISTFFSVVAGGAAIAGQLEVAAPLALIALGAESISQALTFPSQTALTLKNISKVFGTAAGAELAIGQVELAIPLGLIAAGAELFSQLLDPKLLELSAESLVDVLTEGIPDEYPLAKWAANVFGKWAADYAVDYWNWWKAYGPGAASGVCP
jgi:RHS repeat-associated protein